MNRKFETVPRAGSVLRGALFRSDHTVPATAAAHIQTKGIRL